MMVLFTSCELEPASIAALTPIEANVPLDAAATVASLIAVALAAV